MTLAELNAKDRSGFVERHRRRFRGSPWVAERAWEKRPFATLDALSDAMASVVEAAPREEQLSLLRAHPDLGAVRLTAFAQADGKSPASGGPDVASVATGTGRRRARCADARRARTASRAELGVSREVRVPVPVRRQGQHKAGDPECDRTQADVDARRRASGSIAAGVSNRPLQARRHRENQPCQELTLNRFASGPKRHYYGKGDVIAYRLRPRPQRDRQPGVRCERTDAALWRRVLENLHRRATTADSSPPIR